jgi:hypothetical protein
VPQSGSAVGGKMPPTSAGETPALPERLEAWSAEVSAWIQRDDPTEIRPAIPEGMLEMFEKLQGSSEDALETYKNLSAYNQARNRQIARLKGSGGSPATGG